MHGVLAPLHALRTSHATTKTVHSITNPTLHSCINPITTVTCKVGGGLTSQGYPHCYKAKHPRGSTPYASK